MKTNIRKIGNSSGAIIPSLILKKLHLSEGDEIEIIEENNAIILKPHNVKPRYSLEDLINECDLNAPEHSESKWDEVTPVGDEVI